MSAPVATVQPSVHDRLGPRVTITSTTVKTGTFDISPVRPERKQQEELPPRAWRILDKSLKEMEELRPAVEQFLVASKRASRMWRKVKDDFLQRKE